MQFPESTKNNNLFSILACSAICVNAKKKCSDVMWMTVKCLKTTQNILHTQKTYSVTWNRTFFPSNGVEVAIGFSDLQTVNWLINKPTLPPCHCKMYTTNTSEYTMEMMTLVKHETLILSLCA